MRGPRRRGLGDGEREGFRGRGASPYPPATNLGSVAAGFRQSSGWYRKFSARSIASAGISVVWDGPIGN